MPTFDEILQQRLRDQNTQGVPAALDPNIPGQTTNINDLLRAQLPQSPTVAATPSQPMPASTSSQDIPDALLPNDAYQARHKDDLMNRIMAGVPQAQPPKPDTSLPEATPEPEQEKQEPTPTSEEPVKEEKEPAKEEEKKADVPSDVQDKIDAVNNSDNSVESYKEKHDDYGINELDEKQQQARQSANALFGLAATQQAIGNATGHHADTSALTQAANNELGKAQDYQRLLTEQRAEMGEDIRSDAAGVSHQKAVMELGSEKAMSDPNSDISKSARATLSSIAQNRNLNININDKMPYSAIVKVAPWVEKFIQADEMAKSREEQAKQRNLYMQSVLTDRQNKVDDSSLQKLRKEMEASNQSSRSAIGRNAQILDSGDRIKSFLEPILKDPNAASNIDMNELANVMNSMLSNGTATIGGMTKLTPTTMGGDIAKIKQYLTGNIQGANQGEFVKRFLNVVNNEQQVARSKIEAYHNKVLTGYPGLAQRRPDDVKSMVDKFNEDAKASVGTSGPSGTITVRRKSDGAMKTLPASNAQKYLQDPNFEQVQ